MYNIYYYLFAIAICSLAAVEFRQSRVAVKDVNLYTTQFKNFRAQYIVVYCLMMAGDWLQGAFVYRLYEYYQYEKHVIGFLFIFGFASSMLLGTYVGAMVDTSGRKLSCLLYVLLYSYCCLTKHFNNFSILASGRAAGGLATSLLFCSFESWVIAEHQKRGYNKDWLGSLFSRAVWWGNGVVAIACGLVGNFLVEDLELGPVAPFDAAIVVMVVGGVIVGACWEENYGQKDGKRCGSGCVGGLNWAGVVKAVEYIKSDSRILYLGLIQSLFESSMYTFVFLWTPALSYSGQDKQPYAIPHGFIFALFMLACMTGSAMAGYKLRVGGQVSYFLGYMILVGGVCLCVPMLVPVLAQYIEGDGGHYGGLLPDWLRSGEKEGVEGSGDQTDGNGISIAGCIQLVAFMIYEAGVGAFWPIMMHQRSLVLPEESRATIITIFRIPLNLIVCLVFTGMKHVTVAAIFGLAATGTLAAGALQVFLSRQMVAGGGGGGVQQS